MERAQRGGGAFRCWSAPCGSTSPSAWTASFTKRRCACARSESTRAWTSTPVIPLLDSAASAYGTQTFVFSNLLSGVYNLVLFSCNGTESSTKDAAALFTVNGMTQVAIPTQDTSFVLSNNYVVFNQVVVTGSTLNGTWSPIAGKNYGSLNGAQLQYLSPAVSLSIQRLSATQIELQWSQGTLLEATSILGPWTTNTAASPLLLTPSGPQKFYRVSVQ
jgi:hypothetical protein